jgi:hypothetical protein
MTELEGGKAEPKGKVGTMSGMRARDGMGWRRFLKSGLVLAMGLAGAASADYSPMIPGNEWVYQGVGEYEPIRSNWNQFSPRTRFKEELRLKVTGRSTIKDTLIHAVQERILLYDRVEWNATMSASKNLPDTVVIRNLAYKEYNGRIRLRAGDSLNFGHRDTNDLFFYGHSAVAFQSGPLEGLGQGYKGLQARPFWYNGTSMNFGVEGQAWYLDGVGLYWAKLGTVCGMCPCIGKRELLLVSFRGAPVDPGIDPPGSALAKEAKISCSSVNRPIRSHGYGLTADWGGVSVDLMGRSRSTASRLESMPLAP